MSLTNCPGCARHLKLGATECPFCAASVSSKKTITRHVARGAGVLISAAALSACFLAGNAVTTPVYGVPAPPLTPSPSPSTSAQP